MVKYEVKTISKLEKGSKVLFHGGIFRIKNEPKVSAIDTAQMRGNIVIVVDCEFLYSNEKPVLANVLKDITQFKGFDFKEFKVFTKD